MMLPVRSLWQRLELHSGLAFSSRHTMLTCYMRISRVIYNKKVYSVG